MIAAGGFVVDPAGSGGLIDLAWNGDAFGDAGDGAALDVSGALVMPGLVCAHVELGAAFVPGFPKAAQVLLDAMDEDALFHAARLAAMNGALAGATTVFDVWRGFVDGSLDVIARAVEEVGLRAVLSCAVDDSRKAAIAENVRFARRGTARFRASMAIADPERIDAVLLEAASEARRNEMPTHVVLRGEAAARRRVAERGALRAGCLAVLEPGVALDDEERALLRDLQAWVALRPRESAAPHLRGIGARSVLGGRGADAAPLDERAAMRLAGADRDAALAAMTGHGHALAAETFDAPFGRYGAGAPVDLVAVDAALAAPVNGKTLGEHLDRVETRHVRHVVVAGEVVVRDGKAARVDEREVRAKAREALARAWGRALG